jgi:hypothetical protein
MRKVIASLVVLFVAAALTDCVPTQRASKEESEPIEPSSSDQQQANKNTDFDPGQKLEIERETQKSSDENREKRSDRKQEKRSEKKQEASKSNNLNVGDTARLEEGRIRVYQYYG